MKMELFFKTTNPKKLKEDILSLIIDGKLKTWKEHNYDVNKYIKHTPQWGEKGVIDMNVDQINNQLIIKVMPFKEIEEDVKNFEGYYLGRFCEIIFVHFPNSFNAIGKQ